MTRELAIKEAAACAFAEKGTCFWVCGQGDDYTVQTSGTVSKSDKVECIAQFWSGNTVQLRFNGAHSEWVHF